MEEFWKSVKMWQNYGHEFGVQFLAHPVDVLLRVIINLLLEEVYIFRAAYEAITWLNVMCPTND